MDGEKSKTEQGSRERRLQGRACPVSGREVVGKKSQGSDRKHRRELG